MAQLSSQDLNCPVCLQISIDAVESDCCGHAFCSACALLVKNKQNQCPFCKLTPFSFRQAKLIRRMISNIKIECTNNKCEDKVAKGDLENHLRYCIYGSAQCTFCEVKLLKGELMKHTLLIHQSQARKAITEYQLTNQSSKLSLASTISSKLSKLSKKSSNEQISTAIDPQAPMKNKGGFVSQIGESGKYYCGQPLGTFCTCCDGNCGFTNGENCVSCMELDIRMRTLPKGYLVNAAGFIAKVDLENKTAYCGKLFYLRQKCRAERCCIYCSCLTKTLGRYSKLL